MNDLVAQARAALQQRDFERCTDLCNQILASDRDNAEATRIAEQAIEKMEAQPFVEQFVRKAGEQFQSGDQAAARATLEKAKALDADHPDVIALQGRLSGGAGESAPAGFDLGSGGSDFADAFASDSGGLSVDFGSPSQEPEAVVTPEPEPVATPAPEPEPAASDDAPADFSAGFSFDAPPAPEQSDDFVVESENSSPGADAPATDFGFTFEEDAPAAEPAPPPATPAPRAEQPASFSFEPEGGDSSEIGFSFGDDAPPPPPAAEPSVGEAQTFDFASGEVDVSEGDKEKIDRYIREGDQAYERGEYAEAIDVWSRIFLIDVTNDEASTRIEKARRKKVEREERAEALCVEAIEAQQRGDEATAREKYREALELDPSNSAAAEALAAADDGGLPPPPPPPPADDFEAGDSLDSYDEALEAEKPPPPPPRKSAAPTPAGAAKPKSSLPMKPIAAAVAVILLAAAGWFAWSFFAGGEPEIDSAHTTVAFNRAEVLAEQGNYDEAIKTLLTVPAGDPRHEEALQRIADYRRLKTEAGGMIGGRPATEVFNERLEQARSAFADQDFLTAKQAFESASEIRQLPPEAQQMYDQARLQVGKLDSALVLFKEGNYSEAVRVLEALKADDPSNRNIEQLLSNAHFNLGALALQENRTSDAIDSFDKVLAISPDDPVAARSRDLAQRYDGEPKDLLYRIYVKYLPLR